MKDHFKVLGVARNASGDDVKKAYRNLAKLLHPDKNPRADAAQQFQELQQAYDALKNDSDRDLYRRRIENMERIEKDAAKPAAPSSSNNNASSSSAPKSQSFSSFANSTYHGSSSSSSNTQQQQQQQYNWPPKFTFMKADPPPSHTKPPPSHTKPQPSTTTTNGRASFSEGASNAKKTSGSGGQKTAFGSSSRPRSSSKPNLIGSQRIPPRPGFTFDDLFGDYDEDDADAAADAFYSSRDFFRAAFEAFSGGGNELGGHQAAFDRLIFEKLFKPKASAQQQQRKPTAGSGGGKRPQSASSDEDADSDAHHGQHHRGSFFFGQQRQASPDTRSSRGRRSKSSVGLGRRIRFTLTSDDEDDGDYDLDDFPNHPRFGRPHGKFGTKSRKNEEGFISFDDQNPSLLLKCHYCSGKVPAERFEQHEKTCLGFRGSDTASRPASKAGAAAAATSHHQTKASRPQWNKVKATSTPAATGGSVSPPLIGGTDGPTPLNHQQRAAPAPRPQWQRHK